MDNKSINTESSDIENKVYLIRGEKVMLDADLAEIYGVETKRLNEQVKRNKDRFPVDFMFQLTKMEWDALKSQFATANRNQNMKSQNATSKRGGRRTLPYVFTEHGVVMLASVLNSPQAIAASIQIVKVFVKLRTILSNHTHLAEKLKELESKYDSQFEEVFSLLRRLMNVPKDQVNKIILKKGIKE